MDRLVATISRIFEERYGTQLVVQKKSSRSNQQQPLFLSHWPSAFVYSRTLRQVSFPIFNEKRELLAMAIAHPVENKDAIIFDEMAQFLQLTIAEHIQLSEQKLCLDETELAIQRSHWDSSKVIELRTRKKGSQGFEYKRVQTKREMNLDPIWIHEASTYVASQIAFSVHDWAANWAFINAKEIPDLIWSDQTGWDSLAQVTIFIPDIDTVGGPEMAILKKNLESLNQHKNLRPLVIVSSSRKGSSEHDQLQSLFRQYTAKAHITPKIQAHFILFQQKPDPLWSHKCEKSHQVFYLPFSPKPELIH